MAALLVPPVPALAAPPPPSPTPGALDTGFGDPVIEGSGRTGIATAYASDNDYGVSGMHRVLVDSQGRIVVAGHDSAGSGDFLLRLEPDGDLDPTFGEGGRVDIDSGLERQAFEVSRNSTALALGEDDSIYVGGSDPNDGDTSLVRVQRYRSDGSLDVEYGSSGTASPDVSGIAVGLAVTPDRELVVVSTEDFGTTATRLTEDGTPDVTFGRVVDESGARSGSADVPADGEAWAYGAAVVVDPAGRVVVAGFQRAVYPSDFLPQADTWVARLTATGEPDDGATADPSDGFAGDGALAVDAGSGFDDFANDLALAADGTLTVVGEAKQDARGRLATTLRLQEDGALLTGFGGDGLLRQTQYDPASEDDRANGVVVDQSGASVTVGRSALDAVEGLSEFGVARLLDTEGAYDPTFGHVDAEGTTTGRETVDCNAFSRGGELLGVALQPDGKIVAVGLCDFRLQVVRLLGGGTDALANLTLTTVADTAAPSPSALDELEVAAAEGVFAEAGTGTAAAPLRNSPLRNSPLRNADVSGAPLRNSPLRNSPLRNSPLRNSPLRNSPISTLTIAQVPLVPDPDPAVADSWAEVLAFSGDDSARAGYHLDLQPEQTVLLSEVLGLTSPAEVVERVSRLTLDHVDLVAAGLGNVPVAALLLGRTPLSALVEPYGGWCSTLAGTDAACPTDSAEQAEHLGEVSLADAALARVDLAPWFALEPSLLGVAFDDAPLTAVPVASADLSRTELGDLPVSAVDAATLCSSADCGGATTLGAARDAGAFRLEATFGDLLDPAAGVAPDEVPFGSRAGTVGDVVLGLVAAEDLPVAHLDLESALRSVPIPADGLVTYELAVDVDCSNLDSLRMSVRLPAGWRADVENARMVVDGEPALAEYLPPVVERPREEYVFVRPDLQVDPSAHAAAREMATFRPLSDDGGDGFSCAGPGAAVVRLMLDAQPGQRLGPTTADGFAHDGTTELSTLGQAPVSLTDPYQDVAPDGEGLLSVPRDQIVFTWLGSEGDTDYFRVPVPPAGSKVSLSMVVPEETVRGRLFRQATRDVDLDLVLYANEGSGDVPGVAPLRNSPLRNSPLRNSPLRNSPLRNSPVDDAQPADDGTVAPPDDMQGIPLLDRRVRAASVNRDGRSESIDVVVREHEAIDGSHWLLQVSGFNGASALTPAALSMSWTPPAPLAECVTRTHTGTGVRGTLPTAIDPGTQSLILVNRERMGRLYGLAEAESMWVSLQALAAHPHVRGAVVPVDGDAEVAAAYDAWDADPCSVVAANEVVTEVNDLVDDLRTDLTDLRHLVLVGADEALPMGRIPDLTDLANQADYGPVTRFGGKDNAVSRAMVTNHLLSDDPYASAGPSAFLDTQLFVPDVAVGRLVETPADVRAAVADFVATDGVRRPTTSYTAGYDFLTDGAEAVQDALAANIPGISQTSSISETWTRAEAAEGLADAAHGIASVNAHYDNYRALPGLGNFTGSEDDLLDTAPATDGDPADLPEDLAGGILFTMGCNAGLNLTDLLLGGNPTTKERARARDWSQTTTAAGAVFVGNTGYGYGDTEVVAYSERLMAFMAENFDGTMSLGQALQFAKQRYIQLGIAGVYDAKSIQEATYYGLPMYRLGASGTTRPSVLPAVSAPAGAPVALSSERLTFDVKSALQTGERGRYPSISSLAVDGAPLPLPGATQHQATAYRPLQASATHELEPRVDLAEAHGVVIEGLTSSEQAGVDPAYGRPLVDDSAHEPEPDIKEAFFPFTPATVVSSRTPDGRRDVVVLTPGQFTTDGSTDGTGTQRFFEQVEARVTYSSSTDFDAPQVTRADGVLSGGQVVFTAESPDTDVVRALVLFLPDGTQGGSQVWRKVELAPNGAGAWTGVTADPGQNALGEFVVQLVDAAGNVRVHADKDRDFLTSTASDAGFTLQTTPAAPGADGAFAGPVTVEVVEDQAAATTTSPAYHVSVDGAAPFLYSGPFELAGEGQHTVTAVRADDPAAVAELPVRIDSSGPTITVLTPADGAAYDDDSTDPHVVCSDPSGVVSCLAPDALDGGPFVVTATDAGGRTSTSTVTYDIVHVKAPTVTALESDAHPALPNTPVTLRAVVSSLTGSAPTGSVVFRAGTTVLATVPVGGDRSARYTTSALGSGSHSITASYGGDSDHVASTSPPLLQSVADRFVTGGGKADAASHGGAVGAAAGTLGRFDLTVQYKTAGKKASTTPTGNATYAFEGADGYRYVLRATTFRPYGLLSDSAGRMAFVHADATLERVKGNGPVQRTPGYTMRLDLGDGGSSDTFAIRVTAPDGTTFYRAGTSGSPRPVQQGNVTVHSR